VSGMVLMMATLAAARAGSLQFRRTSPRAVADFIRHGTASMGLSLGIVVMSRTDRLFLAAFATPATVAVYALGVTLAELLRLVPTAVGQLLTQKVAEGTAWATVFRIQLLTGLATMLLGGVGSVLAWFLIPVIFGAEYAGARVIVLIMVLGEIAYAFLVLATRGLIGGGWSRPASIIGCVAVAVALPLYAFAASAGGVLGTAWGRVAVSVLAAVAASGRLRQQLTSI
jgi:O-antigen/teichoic acid export membrane protein